LYVFVEFVGGGLVENDGVVGLVLDFLARGRTLALFRGAFFRGVRVKW